MNFDRLIAAFKAFLSSFDYEPPPQLAKTQPASTQVMPPEALPIVDKSTVHDPDTQAELDRIAKAQIHELPPMVTRQAQNDDGSPKRDAQGRVILLNQDYTPLTVVQQAIIDRIAELRRQAGG